MYRANPMEQQPQYAFAAEEHERRMYNTLKRLNTANAQALPPLLSRPPHLPHPMADPYLRVGVGSGHSVGTGTYGTYGNDYSGSSDQHQVGIILAQRALERLDALEPSLAAQEQRIATIEQYRRENTALSQRLTAIENELEQMKTKQREAEKNAEAVGLLAPVQTQGLNGCQVPAPNKLIKPTVPAPALGSYAQDLNVPEVAAGFGSTSLVNGEMRTSAEKKENGGDTSVVSKTAQLRERMLRSRLVKPKVEQGPEQPAPQCARPIPAPSSTLAPATSSSTTVVDSVDGAIARYESMKEKVLPKNLNESSTSQAGSSVPSESIIRKPRMVKPLKPTLPQPTGDSDSDLESQPKSQYPPSFEETMVQIKRLCLNPLKLEEISANILKLLGSVSDAKLLKELVDFIFDSFTVESAYASPGGKLCQRISQDPCGGVGFRNLLLGRCQDEFNNVLTQIGTNPAVEKRSPGLIWFLAELYMNVTVGQKQIRNSTLALATIEFMRTLLAVRGACHLKANIMCTQDVLKLIKPSLIADGGLDDGIPEEVKKLGCECKTLEGSGVVLNVELKKILHNTYLQTKFMLSAMPKTAAASTIT